MSDTILGSTTPPSPAFEWRETGDYGLSHPDGKSRGPYGSIAEAIAAFNQQRA
ncbi:hypothetical protein [Burkholderia sp. Ac-20353]|uniref:hypothetical protein n=1 Tax=Burkholderia sp. Ac-20353 TaxID=2703894 RepID=UPI00197B6FE7|nr:hypothetical protein [Burkholderia sp. Ac-20353]MBN3785497.1 hypothetical protein [Burkholderia sp. Ac-20353]